MVLNLEHEQMHMTTLFVPPSLLVLCFINSRFITLSVGADMTAGVQSCI